jgi:hypothetical protein
LHIFFKVAELDFVVNPQGEKNYLLKFLSGYPLSRLPENLPGISVRRLEFLRQGLKAFSRSLNHRVDSPSSASLLVLAKFRS